MIVIEGLGDPEGKRVQRMRRARRVKESFLLAWFGSLLPFVGLVAFFLVANLVGAR